MTLLSKKLIAFDFDGTLVDSMADFGNIAAAVIARHYLRDEKWAREQYRLTSGLPFPLQLESIFPADKRNVQADEDFNIRKAAFYEKAPFFDGTIETIKTLKEKGFLLTISSNNDPSLIERRLGSHQGLFDRILGYRPGFLKGDQHFRWLQHFFKLETTDVVFVGDSLHDAHMAAKHGIDFIAKAGTFSEDAFLSKGCTFVISSLDQIVALVNKPQEEAPLNSILRMRGH